MPARELEIANILWASESGGLFILNLKRNGSRSSEVVTGIC